MMREGPGTWDMGQVEGKLVAREWACALVPCPLSHVPRSSRRGFTLVEVLMSVAILSLLAVATAAAIGASSKAFDANLASAESLQFGRNAMLRMAAELRTGQNHLPTTAAKQTTYASGVTVTDTGITFKDESGRQITYAYVAASKTVTLKIDAGATATLARGVQSFSVRMVPARSKDSIRTGGIFDELSRATLTMSVKAVDSYADQSAPVTLTQSITPRSRLWE